MFRIHTLKIVPLLAAATALTVSAANHRLSYDQMASDSDKVVLGRVGVKSSHYGEGSRIYTEIVVSPDVTLKGAEEGAVVVQTLGGTVGDVTMLVSDGPSFPDGERVVVFLKKESNHFIVVGRSAGTIPATSNEASAAIEGALSHVERGGGARQIGKRGLAESYLNRAAAGSSSRDAATTSAAQVGCYGTNSTKWNTSSATYKIGSSIPAGWPASIDAATATWNSAGVAFRLVNDSNSTNELSYLDLVAKYGSSYANTYAVTTTWSSNSTGRISKATIEIGTKWPWSISGQDNMADVQNILTHEFGHWMHLLDIYSPSNCSEVTMWGTAGYGETKKRTLDQADIDGFASLYGLGSGGATVGTPVLTSPSNGAAGVSATTALAWAAASGAASYDVYFGTTASPGLVGTVTSTSYQPGTLTAGATYYWRVVAKNSSTSATSATFSFTVASASSGGTSSGPTLLSPENGATGVSLTPVMQWSAVPGAVAYDIYVGTTPSPGRIGSITGTAVTVRGFRAGSVYYWKVVARTNSTSLSSTVASFTTVTN